MIISTQRKMLRSREDIYIFLTVCPSLHKNNFHKRAAQVKTKSMKLKIVRGQKFITHWQKPRNRTKDYLRLKKLYCVTC